MIEIATEALPIKIWGQVEELTKQEGAITQARNLADHPAATQHVALMPDFHLGYGMPVGGVFAAKNAVVPNAVGVDIGCGMMAVKTDMEAASLDRDTLEKIRQAIMWRVPVGFNHHKSQQDLWTGADYEPTRVSVLETHYIAAHYQIGTLGSGNHFIELQKDDDGHLWIMVHSGSRNIGKQVCDYFDRKAIEYCEANHIDLPPPDKGQKRPSLAFLPLDTAEGQQYIMAMLWCMQFASESRERMINAVYGAMTEVLKGWKWNVEEITMTHHNYAAEEFHNGEIVVVHRKGAVKAHGRVIIPGSMGTASYIATGLYNPESFGTCSHGAGRIMGRNEANRIISHEDAVKAMEGVVFGVRQGDYDEMPQAYKDIHQVMLNQADLVTPKDILKPLAVVKG